MHPEMYFELIHCMFSKCGVVYKAKMEKNRAHYHTLLFIWANTELLHLSCSVLEC
jgi:hypothetical protein